MVWILVSLKVLNYRFDGNPEFHTIPSLPGYASKIKATSVPYWDDRCGIIINKLEELELAIVEMIRSRQLFKPREFIEENLSLEKCAEKLINFFIELDFSQVKSKEYKVRAIQKFVLFHFVVLVQIIRTTLRKIKRKWLSSIIRLNYCIFVKISNKNGNRRINFWF